MWWRKLWLMLILPVQGSVNVCTFETRALLELCSLHIKLRVSVCVHLQLVVYIIFATVQVFFLYCTSSVTKVPLMDFSFSLFAPYGPCHWLNSGRNCGWLLSADLEESVSDIHKCVVLQFTVYIDLGLGSLCISAHWAARVTCILLSSAVV